MQLTCAPHKPASLAATVVARQCRNHAAISGGVIHQASSSSRQWQQRAGGSGRRQQQAAAAAAVDEEVSGSADLMRQPSTSSSSAQEDVPDESLEFAMAMAKIAWETKGEDILVLHVAPVVYWTRYFLIATVFSRPQLNAVLGKMTKEATEVFGRRLSQSPQAGPGGWELLDYGDVVVHVMTADQREYYDLETFYGAAEEVNLPFVASEPVITDAETWSKKM